MLGHVMPLGHSHVGDRVLVLDVDADLAAAVPEGRRERAVAASLAATEHVEAGLWGAGQAADFPGDGFGLLVLDGFLIRGVGVDGRFGGEMLGIGDLLRPWQNEADQAILPTDLSWRVVLPLRMAVLDLAWATRMAAFPEIGAALAGRALERSRRLASLMAIVQQPRLDQRLWLLFWELADRHGRVHPDGVHIDLPLTHEILGRLVAARRPSVSSALGRLAAAEMLARGERGWVLRGPAPDRAVVSRAGDQPPG